MRLYVVRHGESVTNQSKTWTGWTDVPLTEKGEQDAAKAGELLKGITFDKVFASDLIRARRTAEIALPGCRYETTPLIREINVGDLAGQPVAVLTREQRKLVAREGYTSFGGETRQELFDRVSRFMKQLEELECETVAAFSHGGWLRAILGSVVGVDLPSEHVCCNNCTVGIFEYVDGIWRLYSWINLP